MINLTKLYQALPYNAMRYEVVEDWPSIDTVILSVYDVVRFGIGLVSINSRYSSAMDATVIGLPLFRLR